MGVKISLRGTASENADILAAVSGLKPNANDRRGTSGTTAVRDDDRDMMSEMVDALKSEGPVPRARRVQTLRRKKAAASESMIGRVAEE